MFARYGFAKTTMSDIATEAGVARQTVYNAFSSKEEVLRAVVRHAGKESLDMIQQEWAKGGTVSDKLAAFHKYGPVSWYEAMMSAPDWAELMDGVHKATAGELAELERIWVAALAEVLDGSSSKGREDAEEIAHFFYTTSKNAKFGVRDVEDLKQRLRVILRATEAMLSAR